MPVPPAASYISGLLHQQPITTASTLSVSAEAAAAAAVAAVVHGGGGDGGGVRDAGHGLHRHPLPAPLPRQAPGHCLHLVQRQIRLQNLPPDFLLEKP